MGFFARGGGQDDEQSESLARIEAGGIPAGAEERLRNLASPPTPGGSLFTSELSVNEFALLGRMGPQPLAQVMGASVVRTGWQYLPALDPAPAVMPRSGGYGARYGITGRTRAVTRWAPASPSLPWPRSAVTNGTPQWSASSTR